MKTNQNAARRRKRRHKLVRIAVADDVQVAGQYKNLLQKYTIPSFVRREKEPTPFNISLYVREENFNTAYKLIESVNGDSGFFGPIFETQLRQPKAS